MPKISLVKEPKPRKLAHRKGTHPNSAWTDQKKVECVTSYLLLGKLSKVSEVTGVNYNTLRMWKMEPWWHDLVRQLQQEETQELDTKLSRVIDKTIHHLNDRIENGDFILDSKTGTVKRVPVKMRDLHRVTSDFIDKRDLIRGRPAQKEAEEHQAERLVKLAEQFKEFAKLMKSKNQNSGVTIDAVQKPDENMSDLPETTYFEVEKGSSQEEVL